MGDDTSPIACNGLPLSCDSPLQLYVRNGRGKVHMPPAEPTLRLWWETEGQEVARCTAKAIFGGKNRTSAGYGQDDLDDKTAGGIAHIHRAFGFNRERFQPQ
jgi:hypothetical protein